MTEGITDDYMETVSRAYWAEQDEMKLGIHPSQVKERIEKNLLDSGIEDFEITFLDWRYQGTRVGVSINNSFYGIFDYEENVFQSTPSERLQETLKLNHYEESED